MNLADNIHDILTKLFQLLAAILVCCVCVCFDTINDSHATKKPSKIRYTSVGIIFIDGD